MSSFPSADPSLEPQTFGPLALRARSLSVFGALLHEMPIVELVALLEALDGRYARGAVEAHAALLRWLVEREQAAPRGGLATHVMDAILRHESALSQHAMRNSRPVSHALAAAAGADLRTLQALVEAIPSLTRAVEELAGIELPSWPGDTPGSETPARLLTGDDWARLLPELVDHYATHGTGHFAQNLAFRWTGQDVEPVPAPDIVDPGTLVGYAAERALLRQNTEQFVAGHPANNVLLYGDRGTGKSSSVKSMLWHAQTAGAPGTDAGSTQSPAEQGAGESWRRLRIVEVPKARLADFPAVVAQLRGRPQRFILFVDDLSFEEGETQYKDMKAMLEGGIEARPENVVVYATSNRRHLIREQFSDRTVPDSQEVHARDTVQEKLSFADRFGMTITFPTPDQTAYLAIVEGLARQRGLPIQPAALRARAIEWAAWHNGRSGRTARQLVDHLEGELGLSAGAAGTGNAGGGETSPLETPLAASSR